MTEKLSDAFGDASVFPGLTDNEIAEWKGFVEALKAPVIGTAPVFTETQARRFAELAEKMDTPGTEKPALTRAERFAIYF